MKQDNFLEMEIKFKGSTLFLEIINPKRLAAEWNTGCEWEFEVVGMTDISGRDVSGIMSGKDFIDIDTIVAETLEDWYLGRVA